MRLLGLIFNAAEKNDEAVERTGDIGIIAIGRLPATISFVGEVYEGNYVAGREAEGHSVRMLEGINFRKEEHECTNRGVALQNTRG